MPFTKCLLGNPEVAACSTIRVAGLAAVTATVTDAALAAVVDVNADALDREEIRELSKQKREKERCSRNGMTIDDDGVAPGDLGEEEGALLAAMDKVKAKGGAMFAAAQQQDNPEGLEFTGLYVRSVAERVAVEQAAAVKTSEANAALRRVAATTTAGGHGRARVAWKAVCAEQVEGHTHAMAAKGAQIRELQAANAAKDAQISALTP